MANRYWVGGSGNVNDNTNHWAASSGGSPGASNPGSSDDVFFDGNSFSAGSKTVTFNVSPTWLSMDCTGAISGATFTMTNGFTVNGSVTFATGMLIGSSGSITISPAISTTANVTMNGVTWPTSSGFITGGAGTVSLVDDLTVTNGLKPGAGTFTTNNRAVTCGQFQNSGTVALNLTNSSIVITGTTNAWQYTSSGTLTAGTSTLTFSGNGAQFQGNGKTYYDVVFQSNCTITGSNTYHSLTFGPGKTITFGSSTNQTITSLNSLGTSGSHIALVSSSPGTTYTLTAGSANTQFTNVTDSIAAGAASPFYDPGGVDGGHNTNWNFSSAPSTDSSKWRGAFLFLIGN